MNINNTLLVIYKAIIKLVFISDTVTVAPPYLQSLSHLLTYSHYHTSLPTVTITPPYLQSLSHLLTYSDCRTSIPSHSQTSPTVTVTPPHLQSLSHLLTYSQTVTMHHTYFLVVANQAYNRTGK